ncbi:MAG TPA: condensation domain-containing protein [Frankiaceae bacterium]|jgi:hypothetical protein|nr:condensation domain-containing protein [Frankiaceae bacterium]
MPETWPLSVQQRSLLARGGAPFNSVATYAAPAPVPDDVLRGALRRLADRHPMLRASVGDSGTTVHDRVEPDVVTARASAAQAPDLLRAEWATGFARDRAPLWRARQYVIEDDTALLALAYDHLVFDALSRSIVLKYLARDDAPAPAATYGEFALWQEREAPEGLAFWRALHDGVPVRRAVPLPFTSPGGDPRPSTLVHRLDAEATSRVAAAARERGVSAVLLLLAGLFAALAEVSGETDLTVRVPVHGRPARFLRVVGWFANDTLCRVARCHPGDALATLPALAEVWPGLQRHQAVPIEVVERSAGVPVPPGAERPRLVTFNATGDVGTVVTRSSPDRPAPSAGAAPAVVAALGTSLRPVTVPRDVAESGLQLSASANAFVVLQCSFDAARFAPGDVTALLAEWARCLTRC